MNADGFMNVIKRNNQRIEGMPVERLLIIFGFKNYAIGDAVLMFSNLRALKTYFPGVVIDWHTSGRRNTEYKG